MSMVEWDDVRQMVRARDRALRTVEGEVEEAAGRAIRELLDRVAGAALTASGAGDAFRLSQVLTLSQAYDVWDEALDRNLVAAVQAAWRRGYLATSDTEIAAGSLAAAGDYVAQVKDRLSRTATPLIPDDAFNTVRVALAEEASRGSSSSVIADRIASDLRWEGPDRGFWQERRSEALAQIDDILDPLGPPGTPEREWARLNDPRVRELQRQNAQAVQQLDRDRSVWDVRANRIARTETTGAFNAGNLEAGIVEGQGAKLWVALTDDATRETHLDAAGQCVPVNEPFEVGSASMQAPGMGGPAEEVVNCRCQMVLAPSCDDAQRIAAPAVQGWQDQLEKRREGTS